MATILETIASYVPALSLRRFKADPTPPTAPHEDRCRAAVLFADVSGFTALAESLAQQGPAGAEELTRILNRYFGELIDLVYAHGGDLVKFAGDALLALWPAGDHDLGLSDLTLRAAACALAMQERLAAFPAENGAKLSLKVGLGAGSLLLQHVGGIGGHWDLLVTGSPLTALGAVMPYARPGEVVLTPGAWDLLSERAIAHLDSAPSRLQAIPHPLSPRPTEVPPVDIRMEAALYGYLPGSILARVMAHHTGWLAELRQVTVLFVQLPELARGAALSDVQRVMEILQTTLTQVEGSINKLSIDEKGVTVVAAMGVPPHAHADDAVRGVQAAWQLHDRLVALGCSPSIGLTTGRAFCGEVGNGRRREYTLIGDVVNLASRLMAAAQGGILCDQHTFQASQNRVSYEALAPIPVKGKAEPVAIFRPLELVSAAVTPRSIVVGRHPERAQLTEQLEKLRFARLGGVIVIEGEAGLGKSRLVVEMGDRAAVMGLGWLRGQGDPYDRHQPYHAWQPVFRQLFHLPPGDDLAATRAQVLTRLGEDPDTMRRAPLINAVLPVDLPENSYTESMTGQVRADNTHDLLIQLLKNEAQQRPLVLAIEDVQWLDSASWTLLRLASQHVQPMTLVVTTRPSDELPAEFHDLLCLPTSTGLILGPMSTAEIHDLVCQRLGIGILGEAIASFIQEKAEGHPLFSEELAFALLDEGYLRIDQDECRLSPHVTDLDSLSLPTTIQGLITGRFDRLAPSEQLLLKVASVVGREFPFQLVRDLYPVADALQSLEEVLAALQRQDWVRAALGEATYTFKQVIAHEVVYNLMLFSQRQSLHRAVADWIEREYADHLGPHYGRLAHHHVHAGDAMLASRYLVLAGDRDHASYANLEAREAYKAALVWHDRCVDPLYPRDTILLRLAKVERDLGELDSALVHLDTHDALTTSSLAAWDLRGNILIRKGQLAEARAAYEHMLTLSREDCWTVAKAHTGLANVARRQGDTAQAIALAEQAMPELLAVGDYETACQAQFIQGVCRQRLGEWVPALMAFDQGMELARRIGNLRQAAMCLNSKGGVAATMGRLEEAQKSYTMSLQLWRRLGDRDEMLVPLSNLGDILLKQGDQDGAQGHFEEAVSLAQATGNQYTQFLSRAGLAEVCLSRGDGLGALAELEACTAIMAQTGLNEHAADIHWLRGQAWLLAGDPVAAKQELEGARAIARGNAAFEGMVDRVLAEVAIAQGQRSEALELARRSEGLLRPAGMPHELARTLALIDRLQDPSDP